ncbi:N-acetyltransferase [Thalassotalea euphylliae]|uniref:N-acetyltransferase n=1 Tax=Thalassotalea euphylliae TaxID=1655234 RepID=A0A3E0TP66_9GAMM|nr:GNAT family N-acetyltransferase [Thalassotalea euphylliae]REL25785.1 N-acetyltransferase [Thalassotalea euphylliae]
MASIRTVVQTDSAAIAKIYNHYIANSTATFEETSISTAQLGQRIAKVLHVKLPWLIIENDQQQLMGYAYASKWRGRSAYRFSSEVSVYISPQYLGHGYGQQLYEALFEQLRALGIHQAIGGITLPNPASIGLHEKLGMKKVAHFDKVGLKFGQWLDVGYWQIDLQQADTQSE